MHSGQCLAPTKRSINVNSHYPNLWIRKQRHWDLLMATDSVNVKTEANPGRQYPSASAESFPQPVVVNHLWFCEWLIILSQTFCQRSVKSCVGLKTYLQILWCTSHQEVGPGPSPGNPVGLCDCVYLWGQVRKHSTDSTWLSHGGHGPLKSRTALKDVHPPWRCYAGEPGVQTERDAQGAPAVWAFPAQELGKWMSLQKLLTLDAATAWKALSKNCPAEPS